jgi:hypothetical protein
MLLRRDGFAFLLPSSDKYAQLVFPLNLKKYVRQREKKITLAVSYLKTQKQSDQIGRIFDQWVIVYFG